MERDWERAIERGDAEWVRNILEHTTDERARHAMINSKDQHGQTGLMVAAVRGHAAVVRLLLENQAELNHTAKYHLSALLLATINRHAEIVRLLVDAGADREIRGTGAVGFAGLPALELAGTSGYEEIAALLRAPSH